MRDFVYYRPASLDEARRLALEEGAMLLAGGQTLLRDMKHGRHSPASLIDITSVVPSRIELHGGAIAANEPAGDYPAACLALGAMVHTTKHEVAATEFFVGHCRTVLEPGEIITAVTFPVARLSAYVKFLNPASRYAMVGVFAAVAED